MRAITLTKTVTRVADIKAGDEFRSDDDEGGVILYWIAEADAIVGEDGITRLRHTAYPSRSMGNTCGWENPDHELTVWRPDA